MKLAILAEAAEELYDAAGYYEEQQEGLGRRLEAEFHYIAYVIREEEIRIVAFGHGHRRPEYWIDRMQ